MMDKFGLILLLFVTISVANADEVYQNSSDICNKCTCSDDGDKFLLDCSDQDFEHVLANWPPHNKTLVATFSHNNITTLEILPVSEQKLKLLFDHCNIKYLDPGVFKEVKNVEFIDLSYNLLTTEEIDGEDFKGPYNSSVYYPIAVKHLNLAYNQIHSLPRKFFANMPDLEELNLEGNDFCVLDQNTQMALSTLSKLKRLNLAENELTELVADAVKNLNSLVELDLSSNKMEFVPETLDYLKNLQILDLSDNYIFELRDGSFLGMINIKELKLDNLPKLAAIHVDSFATMPNLTKVSLRDNMNLRFIDREAFGSNQTIQELHITNTSLSVIDYSLLKWSDLRVLELKDNILECSCDLYKITKNLSIDITRTLDGPVCIDPRTDESVQMYSLNEDICDLDSQPRRIQKAAQHFETLRIILITLSTMFTVTTFVAITIACLRYRKGAALRNYNFATQVQYNPIQTQYRI